MIFVDSHCHIDGPEFDADRDEVVQRAVDLGLKYMLNVATGDPTNGELERGVDVAAKYGSVYAAVGVHPHDAKLYSDEVERRITDLIATNEKVLAWGEIGLDFHYDNSPRDIQIDVFRRQIRAARKLNKPIIIHSRAADDETVQILQEECQGDDFPGGIMHCFGGTKQMMESIIPLGFLISFAGNVTFKKADNLREPAVAVGLDKMLIETDCPFLTPVPHRGKRNEPAMVVETARFLADLKGINLEVLAEQTTRNFCDFFKLPLN
jgi:TatD DNase family protein